MLWKRFSQSLEHFSLWFFPCTLYSHSTVQKYVFFCEMFAYFEIILRILLKMVLWNYSVNYVELHIRSVSGIVYLTHTVTIFWKFLLFIHMLDISVMCILCCEENKRFLFSKLTNYGVIESKRNICFYQIVKHSYTKRKSHKQKDQLLCEKLKSIMHSIAYYCNFISEC